MLPDIGISEYVIIAAAALIFIGPKDLPKVLRTLGQWVAKMRNMAADFRNSFEDMARQSELDDLRREVEAMRSGQLIDPARMAADAADSAGQAEINQTFADIEAGLKEGGTLMHPPMGHHYMPGETAGDLGGQMRPIDGPAEGAPKPPRKPRASRARSKA